MTNIMKKNKQEFLFRFSKQPNASIFVKDTPISA